MPKGTRGGKRNAEIADPLISRYGAYAYQLPAIEAYVGANDVSASANAINTYLSNANVLGLDPTAGNSRNADLVRTLDQAMNVSPLESNMTLYRGVTANALRGVKVGDIIDFYGRYTSASESKAIAEGYRNGGVMLKINAPKGTPSINVVKALNSRANANAIAEKERIIARGTKYKVIAINDNEVELKIVN